MKEDIALKSYKVVDDEIRNFYKERIQNCLKNKTFRPN